MFEWDDISYMSRCPGMSNVVIDRRTPNLIHLSDGTIKYDFDKFDSFWDAIEADYTSTPTDEQLRESIEICFSEEIDRKQVFEKLKKQYMFKSENLDILKKVPTKVLLREYENSRRFISKLNDDYSPSSEVWHTDVYIVMGKFASWNPHRGHSKILHYSPDTVKKELDTREHITK